MPSKSPAQANLMRAVAHGWKKPGGGGPSRAVAREFVNADRYWTGGLAAMNEINSGVPVTLKFQAGGSVLPLTGNAAMQAALEPVEGAALQNIDMSAFMADNSTMSRAVREGMMAGLTEQGYFGGDDNIWYAPTPTVTGGEPAPPRIIPGAVGTPAAGSPFGSDVRPPGVVNAAPPWTPERAEQTAARRQSPYRDQLREHKARVVSALNPGPQPVARGGYMNYQEGGTARPKPTIGGGPAIPGHSEGRNPFDINEMPSSYAHWEKEHHYDLDAPPPVAEEEEEGGGIAGWILDLLGFGPTVENIGGRTEQELEAIGEARGGRVGYQVGGLAQAQGRFRRPRGGVPPSFRGRTPRAGGVPPQMDPGGGRYAGGSPGFYAPGGPGRGGGARANLGPGGGGRMYPGGSRNFDETGGGGRGIPGGARVPPNMRGYLQKQRMMNRPPANVGGGVNRVGQQDQQGGLARALQRGTGRPPMSRRAGFPGRGVR